MSVLPAPHPLLPPVKESLQSQPWGWHVALLFSSWLNSDKSIGPWGLRLLALREDTGFIREDLVGTEWWGTVCSVSGLQEGLRPRALLGLLPPHLCSPAA